MKDAARLGDWMQTASGRAFWPLDPRPDEIFIEDIAHSLSMQCRFGGHTKFFYSVAEHSVYVSHIVPPEYALWGLLHDAAEAYVIDVPRPIKPALHGYAAIEANVMRCIAARFDLEWPEPQCVKIADNAILADEAEQVMLAPPRDWGLPQPPAGWAISGLSPDRAKRDFLYRFQALIGRLWHAT